MSYKHALALTAFGLGAVLQGCSEDDEKEPCTVNCEDKCKDITDYKALAKGTIYEEGCGTCIVGRLPSDVEGDTNILKWEKALTDAVADAATDVQKALPLEALQYCGAKQHVEACDNTDSVDHVNTKAGIDTAVLELSDDNCGFCYLLVDVTDCATGKKSLTDCGNAPELKCTQDYSCHDIAGAYDDLEDATDTVNNVCKTCLDAEIVTDTDITETTWVTAWAATNADAEVLADHLLHCGAEQNVGSCVGADLDSTTADALLTEINSENAGVCEVCVHMGTFAEVDSPTCRELKTSLATCGAADAAQDVICPECVDFAVDNANCKTCLTEQLNGASDWAAPALTDEIASYADWAYVATCGAVIATDACDALDEGITEAATTVVEYQAAVAKAAPACNACLNLSVLQSGAVDVGSFEDARIACSPPVE